MVEITVNKLAEEIQVSVELLLQQLAAAGIQKNTKSVITQQEKEQLLVYLNSTHNNTIISPCKLTLQRKTRSTLSVPSSGGKSKFIHVEVRKKRTYIKREALEEASIDQQKLVEQPKKATQIQFPSIKKDEVMSSRKQDKVFDETHSEKSIEKQALGDVNPVKDLTKDEKLLKIQSAELQRKVEEQARRKAEANAKRLAEESLKLVVENERRWEEIEKQQKSSEEYHLTTSLYAQQAEDDADLCDESGKSDLLRSNKIVKQKKNTKSLDSKLERDEIRPILHGKAKSKTSTLRQSFKKPIQPIVRDVIVGQSITVSDLASKMAVKGAEVIKILIKMGIMATINQVIDQDTAQLVVEDLGHKVILLQEDQLETDVMSEQVANNAVDKVSRAPVVTIMGHVDHGKTSLLDYIRSTKVAAGEFGGITQHIGAYHVTTENGTITFLDTPGHAAFTSMRARGVEATDIVVLVVAADDNVMPQTIEAIQHAKAAHVPIIVALNKMDKPEANPDTIQKALSQHGIISEDWGGDTQFIPVSAKTGFGIDSLLNAILLQAEMLELTATRSGMASGVVIESFLDKGRGPVSTILVQQGILNKGDVLLCGFNYGRVRAMRNELGEDVAQAGPSLPVEVLGLSGVSAAGDRVMVVRDEKKARELAVYRQNKHRELRLAGQQRVKLETIFTQPQDYSDTELNLIIKADVHGSVQAISEALLKLSTDEVKIRVVGLGVGAITETDATLAAATKGIIIGFNVRADKAARGIIESEGLDLRYYSIIYDIINEIKQAMSGLLEPEYKQKVLGLAEVRELFRSPKFGIIAGCMVTEGLVRRNGNIRILRDNVVIFEGELKSLRHFKEDVSEARSGMECGIGIKNYHDMHKGDLIEFYETIEIKRSID